VVLEDGTSIIVPQGFTARLCAAGELLIEDAETAGRVGEIAA
jgi:hypothetical protein